jgi:hypothetical protein
MHVTPNATNVAIKRETPFVRLQILKHRKCKRIVAEKKKAQTFSDELNTSLIYKKDLFAEPLNAVQICTQENMAT